MSKRMSSEKRRAQAAEAAIELAENGLSAITLTGVAKLMGVVPSALYRHFHSKEDLMNAVMAHMRSLIEDNARTAVAEAQTPVDALRRLARYQMETLAERPGVLRLLFSEEICRNGSIMRTGVENTSGHFRRRIREIIEQGQGEGLIRKDIPSHDLMFAFLGTLLPPMFIHHLSGGEFNFATQAKRNWQLFEDSIKPEGTS